MIQTLFGSVEQEPSLLEKLKSGVQKTRAGLVNALEDALQGKKEIDADLLDELEYTLISADIGVATTNEILESIRQRVERHQLADAAELKGLIREQLLELLRKGLSFLLMSMGVSSPAAKQTAAKKPAPKPNS